MSARALGLAAAAALLVGCGAGSPDLFEVTRSGDDPGADLRMVVSDAGSVSCNGGSRALDSERLLTARALARALAPQAALGIELKPAPGSQLRYELRMDEGTLAFSDNSRGRPPSFDRLVAFTADVAERVCGIER